MSLSPSFAKNYSQEKVPILQLSRPDLAKVHREDRENGYTSRFAVPVKANLNFENSGKWIEFPNGDRIWRLRIKVPEAKGLACLYDQFFLPPGAALYMFSEDGKQVLGAYTHRNNKKSQKFLTGFVDSETIVLEYFEPASVKGQGKIHIFRVDYKYIKQERPAIKDGYHASGSSVLDFGFGTSLDCHVNINCPEGANSQITKNGICRIMLVVEEGSGWCSGSLVNTVEPVGTPDNTPYVLTGFHCQDGYTPLYDFWRFDFHYESSTCDNPDQSPTFQSFTGCEKRAGWRDSDFLLVEMTANPGYFLFPNIYYNGWNRADSVPLSTTNIHHPTADIKKISIDNDPATVFPLAIAWNNDVTTPANHHFEVNYDSGTFEVGSSGSPLFDSHNRIVGQLNGGNANCSQFEAFFGRLSKSWEGGGSPDTRLKDWLDPFDYDATLCNGDYYVFVDNFTFISGSILTEEDEGISNVQVILEGLENDTITTDSTGEYLFYDLVPGQNYGLSFHKNTNAVNGVSTFDMLLIRKHILGVELLDSPYKMIAADVNNSGSISTFDMIQIRKVILGIETEFTNTTSWKFIPDDYVFPNPLNPFMEAFPTSIQINNIPAAAIIFNVIGTKMGDVNNSTDPLE